MGRIELDPASSDIAQRLVRADRYFTKDNDGLAQSWRGRVYLNPPYSKELIGRFADKLVDHYLNGDIPAAVVLVNNATETSWFQALAGASSAVCFVTGRVKFLDPEGNPGAPLQGQAVLYLGPDVKSFKSEFGVFGHTWWKGEPSPKATRTVLEADPQAQAPRGSASGP